jgi:hypothetical protein
MRGLLKAIYTTLMAHGGMQAAMPSGWHHGFMPRSVAMPYGNYGMPDGQPTAERDSSIARIATAQLRFQMYGKSDTALLDILDTLKTVFYTSTGAPIELSWPTGHLMDVQLGGEDFTQDPDRDDDGEELWLATLNITFTYQWNH